MKVSIYSDGGIKPQPCCGFVVRDEDGLIIDQKGIKLPEGLSSNEAEWCGLIAGMHHAKKLGATEVKAHGDSQLVMRQASGQYAVRAEHLMEFHEELQRLVANDFEAVSFHWIPRKENELADRLGREACE